MPLAPPSPSSKAIAHDNSDGVRRAAKLDGYCAAKYPHNPPKYKTLYMEGVLAPPEAIYGRSFNEG